MKYLISSTDVYRIDTVDEVEAFHEELKNDSSFTLSSFGYKTKPIKEHGEIIDEYQLVTVKKSFNLEKEPETTVHIIYEVE